MDEEKNLRKYCSLLIGLITLFFASIFLAGCATCEPYIGSSTCRHLDWIPDHYQGHCFVPGHYMCYKGTSACPTMPWVEGYWKRCDYWKSSRFLCSNHGQSWKASKQYHCCTCSPQNWRAIGKSNWWGSHGNWKWPACKWPTWRAPQWHAPTWRWPAWHAPQWRWNSWSWKRNT